MDKIRELISIASGEMDSFSAAPTREDWEEMLSFAKKQSLVGVLFPALDRVSREQRCPLNVYARWALMAEKIKKANSLHLERARELHARLASDGRAACILKGQGFAAMYRQPDLRQCGDIDVWIDGSLDDTLSYLKKSWSIGEVCYHHCDVRMFKDVKVEAHFTPSWMNGVRANRRLQAFFRAEAGLQFSRFDPELGFCVPTDRFSAVYGVVHVFRHLFSEGVGLRQLMDYRYLLPRLDAEDRGEVMKVLRSLGLERFAAALMYALKEMFGVGDDLLLCEPEEAMGRFFLEEVMISGNFGIADARNAHAEDEGRVHRAWRHTVRQLRLISFYPSEVLSAPLFRLWQYLWRRKNGFL